jgi:hypothetical protein
VSKSKTFPTPHIGHSRQGLFLTRPDCQSNAKPSEKDHDLLGIRTRHPWSSSQHTQPLHHLGSSIHCYIFLKCPLNKWALKKSSFTAIYFNKCYVNKCSIDHLVNDIVFNINVSKFMYFEKSPPFINKCVSYPISHFPTNRYTSSFMMTMTMHIIKILIYGCESHIK